MSDVLMLVVAAALPPVAVLAIRAIDRLAVDTVLGAQVVLVLMVATKFMNNAMPTPVIGGFTIIPADIVFALIAFAAVARLLRAPRLDAAQIGLVVLAILVFVSLVRGVAVNGLQTAVNESRVFLNFVFGTLYFSLSPPTARLRQRIGQAMLWAAGALIFTVVLRWAVIPTGLPLDGILAREAEAGGIRVIDNPATLVLAWTMFMLLPLWLDGRLSGWHRRLMFLLPPIVLLLNHRTVWLAVIVGILVVAVKDARLGRRIVGTLAAVGIVAGVVIIVLSSAPDTRLPQDPLSTHTFLWRWQGWIGLLTHGEPGLLDLLFGRPLGSGYERVVFGYLVEVTPHNWFLQTFLRTGLVGLIAFVITLGNTLLTLARSVPEDDDVLLNVNNLYTLSVMLSLYLLTWAPDVSHTLVLGLAVALASAIQLRMPDMLDVPDPEPVVPVATEVPVGTEVRDP